jgi:hypothetical protein
MPIGWATPCSNFKTDGHFLSAERARGGLTIAASTRSIAMLLGLTILAVLTFIAIGEVRKTGKQLQNED